MPLSTLGVLLNLSGVKYHFAFDELTFPGPLWLEETCGETDCGEGAGGSNCEDECCTPPDVVLREGI